MTMALLIQPVRHTVQLTALDRQSEAQLAERARCLVTQKSAVHAKSFAEACLVADGALVTGQSFIVLHHTPLRVLHYASLRTFRCP